MAIENGGDDYITKPFHLDIVMAKVKVHFDVVMESMLSAESDCLGVMDCCYSRPAYWLSGKDNKLN